MKIDINCFKCKNVNIFNIKTNEAIISCSKLLEKVLEENV